MVHLLTNEVYLKMEFWLFFLSQTSERHRVHLHYLAFRLGLQFVLQMALNCPWQK